MHWFWQWWHMHVLLHAWAVMVHVVAMVRLYACAHRLPNQNRNGARACTGTATQAALSTAIREQTAPMMAPALASLLGTMAR